MHAAGREGAIACLDDVVYTDNNRWLRKYNRLELLAFLQLPLAEPLVASQAVAGLLQPTPSLPLVLQCAPTMLCKLA